MKSFILLSLIVLGMVSCQPAKQPPLLLDILKTDSGPLKTVLERPNYYEVQILYTQVDRDSNQVPHFTQHSYRLDDSAYFYPASTVKFPAAVLALEKLKALDLPRDAVMFTDSAYSGQSTVSVDSSAENGLPSVGHYIRKIMLVSDNDAFNRLYEFLGQGPLRQSLQAKGYEDTYLRHRLAIFLSPDENRHTNPVRFQVGGEEVYQQGLVNNPVPLPQPAMILKGVGEMIGGELVEKPKDFASKNAFPLSDQQQMMQAIMFPELAGNAGFDLRPDDYPFLYQAMSQLPRESSWPAYPDRETYYDSYVKFFLYGDSKDPIPDHMRIFNKVGVAYGYLTDNAYVVDFENGVEFFLSATLSVNENQIFNDGNYEYEEIGFPFLAELGRKIYEYERQREKTVLPDLSRFAVHK